MKLTGSTLLLLEDEALLRRRLAGHLERNGVEVTQVVLMAPAALTHHDDGGQRCVRLTTLYPDDSDKNSLHFKMPATSLHAPPGWYMLFLITNEGVPANAFFVNLG